MRKKDREILDINKIIEIIEICDVCRIALNDEEYPYILPLNFGFKIVDDEIVLYFHGALEGYKYQLIEKNNKASFEMDINHELYSDKETGYCTMNYVSIVGQGNIEIVEEYDEKLEALKLIVSQYHKEYFEFNPKRYQELKYLN